jgi:hypothetical protein
LTLPSYPCTKCGQSFPINELHAHFASCKGPQAQAWPQQQATYPVAPAPLPQKYYIPQVPAHQHIWIKNQEYEWCADPSCHKLKLHLRGWWFLFVRYGLKLFWIQMLVSIVLALGLVSLFHVGR